MPDLQEKIYPESPPYRMDFSSFPLELGEWQGIRGQLKKWEIEMLNPTEYIIADYRNDANEVVNLYAGFWASKERGGPHRPEICLTGGGWQILEVSKIGINGISVMEDPINVNRIRIEKGGDIYKPDTLHNFSMYLEGKWYSLTAKENTYNDSDPIGVLDVTILTDQVLDPLLDIQDLRRSKRIDFVGGIRGLGELKKRVDSGEMKVAFALYPVSMKQLINIADNNMIMPPKTTWFEPKLRSGLVVHELD